MKNKFFQISLASVFLLTSISCSSIVNNNTVKTEQYTVDFNLNGGLSDLYEGPQKVSNFDDIEFFFDCKREGYSFRGWAYCNTKVLDENGKCLSKVEMQSSMIFDAVYNQKVQLSLKVNMPEAGYVSGNGEYPYNSSVDISAHPNNGYQFLGWYYQDTLLSNSNDYRYILWDEDVTIEARFGINSYIINVHTNNSDNGLVLLKSTGNNEYRVEYEETRKYKSEVSVAAYSKNDTRFLGWYDERNVLVQTNPVFTFEMPYRDYSLEAKWNYFTITYNLYGGTNDSLNPTFYTNESSPIILKAPQKTGYDFVGWMLDGEIVTIIDPNLKKNINLDAVWNAHTYQIFYELYGGTNNANNPSSYTIESNNIHLKDACRFGYEFDGWYSSVSYDNKVTQIVRGTYGDKTFHAKWTPIKYLIVYLLDGGTNNAGNPSSYTIESHFTFGNPEKLGYYFAGWYDENGNQITSIQLGTTGELVLIAHWTPVKNELSIESENTSKGTVSIISGIGFSGETITVSANPLGECVFAGWYHNDIKISDHATFSFTMPTNNYSLIAHFFSTEEAEEERQHAIKYGTRPIISEDGDTITYGLYPKKNISSSSSIYSALNSIEQPEANGWYLYNNEYYAKITASINESGYTFDNGKSIVSGNNYWFKCEPIVWNIMHNDNDVYLLLSNELIDSVIFNERDYYAIDGRLDNNYEFSSIRQYLNNEFISSAFNLNDAYIKTTNVDNSAATTDSENNSYICNDTQDRIFLFSYQDYLNTSFGFSDSIEYDNARLCRTTDFARAKGAEYYKPSYGSPDYNGLSVTRSPCFEHAIYRVGSSGDLHACIVDADNNGVRPAINIVIAL